MIGIIIGIGIFFFGIFMLSGIRIIRPTHRGLIETFGKYRITVNDGFRWIVPVVQRLVYVNITEQMVDVKPQTVITKDKLNAIVDAVVYYKIRDAKASQYNVDDHEIQLTSLARTTLRAVIGKMSLTEANENRDKINSDVEKILDKETDSYGVEILRVEIQKIQPPQDVQEAMNKVVKAEQERVAAKDLATATEIKADGEKRGQIKKAEGIGQGKKIVADAEAYRIKIVNESSNKYFKGNAQKLKQLQVTENSLANNSKIILTEKGIKPTLLIGQLPTGK